MAAWDSDARDGRQKARFDAFFDFYFPRIYGWVFARTQDRESAERLARLILERAVEYFDCGEPDDHAAWVLDVAQRTLAACEKERSAEALPGHRRPPRWSLARR